MRAQTFVVAGIAALAVIALIGVIAANPFSTRAAAIDSSELTGAQAYSPAKADVVSASQATRPDGLRGLQADEDGDKEDGDKDFHPYIGVVVANSENGEVKVIDVIADSPSVGVLEPEDSITAVDGVAINRSKDLIEAVTEAGVGSEITLTVTRDGSEMQLSVSVGERQHESWKHDYFGRGKHSGFSDSFRMRPMMRWGNPASNIARSEMVVENADGEYVTYRTVFGKITDIDETSGAFILQPKDGSAQISYEVDDETQISMSRSGDISGLNTEDETLVMDADGSVEFVHQWDMDSSSGHGSMRPFRHFGGKGLFHQGFPHRGGRHNAGDWDEMFSDMTDFLHRHSQRGHSGASADSSSYH